MEYVIRFNLKEGKAQAFVQWLKDNRDAMASGGPEGWSRSETLFTVRGFGDYACETRWTLTNYGALDSANPPGFERLIQEWSEFVVGSSIRGALLKSADEVIVLGDG